MSHGTHQNDPGTDEAETDSQRTQAAAAVGADEPGQATVNHGPSRRMQVFTIGGALLATLLTAPFTPLAMPFGLAGLVMISGSLLRTYSLGWLTVGTAMILCGALISGAYGVLPPELMVLAVGTAIVAWDAGQHGIVIGEQLGRQAPTRRNELVHVAGSSLAVGLISACLYTVFLLGEGGQPGPAVALLVLGTLILAMTLKSQ